MYETIHTTLTALAAFEAVHKPTSIYATFAAAAIYTWFVQWWLMENVFGSAWVGRAIIGFLVRVNVVAGVLSTFAATAAYASMLVGLVVALAVFIPLVLLRACVLAVVAR